MMPVIFNAVTIVFYTGDRKVLRERRGKGEGIIGVFFFFFVHLRHSFRYK